MSIIILSISIFVLTFSNTLFLYNENRKIINSDVVSPIINLDKISILSISNEDSIIEIKFKIHNPNQRSVILQMLKYELYGNEILINMGQIGERIVGMMSSSNYFTILKDGDVIITDKIIIRKNDDIKEFWDSMIDDNIKWHVKGTIFFNLSSMTSSEENQNSFDLYK